MCLGGPKKKKKKEKGNGVGVGAGGGEQKGGFLFQLHMCPEARREEVGQMQFKNKNLNSFRSATFSVYVCVFSLNIDVAS